MSERGGLPASPPKTPGFPQNPLPLPFEGFDGLNTRVPRPSIKDTEMSICDGWIQWGPNYLRTLWGTGDPILSAPPNSIVWFAWGNLSDQLLCFVLKTDGSITESNLTGSLVSVIAPAGTIQNPSSVLGFSQWGSQYIIFAAPQDNGYWLWDGFNLFGAGTLSPVVTLTNSGSNYSGAPTFALQTTGSGTGETFSATITNGSIDNIRVTNPGSGFAVGDFSVLSITGGGSDDTAIATVGIAAGGGLSGVQVLNGGNRYSASSYATVTGGGGSGAAVALQAQAGVITGITIVNPGTGYTSPPAIGVTDPTATGTGFVGTAEISFGQIGTPTIVSGGTGYTTPPVVTVIGDGSGAQVEAQIAGGVVTALTVVNPGFGYTKALLQFSGGNNGASATVSLMPFGVRGSTVETAFSRVWVSEGGATPATFPPDPPLSRTIFSAPGDPSDFLPSHGAGAFISNDSFLRVGYHSLKQTNGFLYLIGDSSLNYISGVTTSSTGTPPTVTTAFQNTNSDPQVGTPWPGSVQVFKRNIVFANSAGVFISYGGAVTKISDALDGFYASGPIFALTGNFTSAVADLYDVIRAYMLLLPVIDPATGVLTNKLLIWDEKKWVTASQDRPLTFITSQEINSTLKAWGTDGTSIFPLFQTPSSSIRKTVQSKLWSAPSYYFQKQGYRLCGMTINFSGSSQSMNIFIDNEVNTSTATAPSFPVLAPNINVFGPLSPAQSNNGRLLGLTIRTHAPDLAILSVTLFAQVFETNI